MVGSRRHANSIWFVVVDGVAIADVRRPKHGPGPVDLGTERTKPEGCLGFAEYGSGSGDESRSTARTSLNLWRRSTRLLQVVVVRQQYGISIGLVVVIGAVGSRTGFVSS